MLPPAILGEERPMMNRGRFRLVATRDGDLGRVELWLPADATTVGAVVRFCESHWFHYYRDPGSVDLRFDPVDTVTPVR